MFAEETPGLESVPTGLTGEEDLLVELVLHVGLDIAQSLLGQPTERAGEGRVGIHVEVLIDLLVHLREVENVREILRGVIRKQDILLQGEVLKPRGHGWLCFYSLLFYSFRHFI